MPNTDYRLRLPDLAKHVGCPFKFEFQITKTFYVSMPHPGFGDIMQYFRHTYTKSTHYVSEIQI